MIEIPGDQVAVADVLVAESEHVIGCDREPRHQAQFLQGRFRGPYVLQVPVDDEIDDHGAAHGAVQSDRVSSGQSVTNVISIQCPAQFIEKHHPMSIYQYIYYP
jgi:hypothetical protein